MKPFMIEDVAAFVGPEVGDREELTAGLPTSHFKNLENYVDESEVPFETKELLRQIRDAIEAENWWEAGNLAYSTLELENLAGEHVVWTEGESYGNSMRTRYFYSEYDGCRFRISNNIVILPDDWSVRTVQVEIRPESGQGCYIY